jgi:hypothetical protein
MITLGILPHTAFGYLPALCHVYCVLCTVCSSAHNPFLCLSPELACHSMTWLMCMPIPMAEPAFLQPPVVRRVRLMTRGAPRSQSPLYNLPSYPLRRIPQPSLTIADRQQPVTPSLHSTPTLPSSSPILLTILLAIPPATFTSNQH